MRDTPRHPRRTMATRASRKRHNDRIAGLSTWRLLESSLCVVVSSGSSEPSAELHELAAPLRDVYIRLAEHARGASAWHIAPATPHTRFGIRRKSRSVEKPETGHVTFLARYFTDLTAADAPAATVARAVALLSKTSPAQLAAAVIDEAVKASTAVDKGGKKRTSLNFVVNAAEAARVCAAVVGPDKGHTAATLGASGLAFAHHVIGTFRSCTQSRQRRTADSDTIPATDDVHMPLFAWHTQHYSSHELPALLEPQPETPDAWIRSLVRQERSLATGSPALPLRGSTAGPAMSSTPTVSIVSTTSSPFINVLALVNYAMVVLAEVGAMRRQTGALPRLVRFRSVDGADARGEPRLLCLGSTARHGVGAPLGTSDESKAKDRDMTPTEDSRALDGIMDSCVHGITGEECPASIWRCAEVIRDSKSVGDLVDRVFESHRYNAEAATAITDDEWHEAFPHGAAREVSDGWQRATALWLMRVVAPVAPLASKLANLCVIVVCGTARAGKTSWAGALFDSKHHRTRTRRDRTMLLPEARAITAEIPGASTRTRDRAIVIELPSLDSRSPLAAMYMESLLRVASVVVAVVEMAAATHERTLQLIDAVHSHSTCPALVCLNKVDAALRGVHAAVSDSDSDDGSEAAGDGEGEGKRGDFDAGGASDSKRGGDADSETPPIGRVPRSVLASDADRKPLYDSAGSGLPDAAGSSPASPSAATHDGPLHATYTRVAATMLATVGEVQAEIASRGADDGRVVSVPTTLARDRSLAREAGWDVFCDAAHAAGRDVCRVRDVSALVAEALEQWHGELDAADNKEVDAEPRDRARVETGSGLSAPHAASVRTASKDELAPTAAPDARSSARPAHPYAATTVGAGAGASSATLVRSS